jgi:hypothetical protein
MLRLFFAPVALAGSVLAFTAIVRPPNCDVCLTNNQVKKGTWQVASCDADVPCATGNCEMRQHRTSSGTFWFCGCNTLTFPPDLHECCFAMVLVIPGSPPSNAPFCTSDNHVDCGELDYCDPEANVTWKRCICTDVARDWGDP